MKGPSPNLCWPAESWSADRGSAEIIERYQHRRVSSVGGEIGPQAYRARRLQAGGAVGDAVKPGCRLGAAIGPCLQADRRRAGPAHLHPQPVEGVAALGDAGYRLLAAQQ